MTHSSQAKGDRAEREVQKLIREHTGCEAPRLRLTGQDVGDLRLPDCVIQVKSYADMVRAVREGLEDCTEQQSRAGLPFGATFVRRPGGRYIVVMTPDQFFSMWREAVA